MRNPIPALAALVLLGLAATPALGSAGTTYLTAGQENTVATWAMKAGDSVNYQWSSGLGVELVITRGGTEVFTTSGPAVVGSYNAPSDGTYSFTFRNTGAYMSVVSWNLEPHLSSDTSPLLVGGIAAAAIGGGVAGTALWMRKRAKAPAAPVQAPPPPP